MTIDDDNSIYVGGLPYDCSEDAIRRVFDLYGAIVAIKIINDREIGGKCYGFVTFTNPRSAVDAINDMDGRSIGGRVVRVNEARTRGGRPNFSRKNIRHDTGRDINWDRGRDRERDYDHDRDRYRDRNSDRSRDSDLEKERGYARAHDHDRTRDHFRDRDQDREDIEQESTRNHIQDWERDRDLSQDRDRQMDRTNDHDRSRDKDKDQQSKNRKGSSFIDRRSRELSSSSSDDYHDQVKEQLEISIQRREELQNEISHIEEKFEEKQQLVLDLQKKSQKLEDALATAKKLSSHRQMQLGKVIATCTILPLFNKDSAAKCLVMMVASLCVFYSCIDVICKYRTTLKDSKAVNRNSSRVYIGWNQKVQKLLFDACFTYIYVVNRMQQSLVDMTMIEADVGDDAGMRDGALYPNGRHDITLN
ncbi:hypothetical protein HHK36_006115 [Tetracentron sinense]|uniref:RRM domain-containing protein n=1 Tax=Tetracentron sinense TaxID=13715 RepID=A0A834ZGM8_TETSI|nr:hypothetical protein HHK36_006115 [Tetracentron sinense]